MNPPRNSGHRRVLAACLLFLLLPVLCCAADHAAAPSAELVGIARLPADRFTPGPVSGQYIDAVHDPVLEALLPFTRGQPLQGFSALVPQGRGRFLALADNGFGTRDNSADFFLTIYRIEADFRTQRGGDGTLQIDSAIRLRDPWGYAPFTRVAENEEFPSGPDAKAVDAGVRSKALLSGADFDPESLQELPDHTYWVGDEFGPWLLHFDSVGRLMDAPVGLPGVKSPDHPALGSEPPLARRSGGFEGMALDPQSGLLYPMLEKPLQDDEAVLNIYRFDPLARRFLEQPPMRYPLDEGATAAGDIVWLASGQFLVVERDSEQGAEARIKRIYRVAEGEVDEQGRLRKHLVVDLLHIADPLGLAAGAPEAADGVFSFSYQTIESLVVLGRDAIGVMNDNNYPFGTGPRGDPADGPEGTVFIILKVPDLWRAAGSGSGG